MSEPPVDTPTVETLRDLAAAVAEEAGQLLLEALDGARTVDTKSTSTDMVTEMDRAAEALVVSRIRAQRPDDAILGEEGTDRAATAGSRVRWVIDPLDGTTNYLYRLPGWNVSVGVEVDEEPVAGAVVIPASGDTFAAASGRGATHNGRPIQTRAPVPVSQMLFGTGFAYESETRARQGQSVAALLPRVRDIRRVGAAAGDLCAVAAGRLDAFYESGLAAWDRAAGTVIAREAGTRVENVETGPLSGLVTVAAHPDTWDDVTSLLTDVGVL